MRKPFPRLRAHVREAVEAARLAGRESRDRDVAIHGQAVVDEHVPAWMTRWLDDDRHNPQARRGGPAGGDPEADDGWLGS